MKRDILLGAIGVAAVSLYLLIGRKPPAVAHVLPRVQIDPLYRPLLAPRAVEPVGVPVMPDAMHVPTMADGPRAPHEKSGFGLDSARNTDDYEVDDYLNLPLVGTGKTYVNENAYQEVDEDAATVVKPIPRYKYIRLQVSGVRTGHTVEVGGIRFFKGRSMDYYTNLSTWNPHTGEREAYHEQAWTDNDQRMIIFCFPELVQVNRYEYKTSSGSTDNDPIRWTVEGSVNGTFWTVLDDRSKSDANYPVQREVWVMYRMNRVE